MTDHFSEINWNKILSNANAINWNIEILIDEEGNWYECTFWRAFHKLGNEYIYFCDCKQVPTHDAWLNSHEHENRLSNVIESKVMCFINDIIIDIYLPFLLSSIVIIQHILHEIPVKSFSINSSILMSTKFKNSTEVNVLYWMNTNFGVNAIKFRIEMNFKNRRNYVLLSLSCFPQIYVCVGFRCGYELQCNYDD